MGMQPMMPPQNQRQIGGPMAPVGAGVPQGRAMQPDGRFAPRAPRGPWNANSPSQVFDGSSQGSFNSNPNWGNPSGGPNQGW